MLNGIYENGVLEGKGEMNGKIDRMKKGGAFCPSLISSSG
jgi:hypothetical protein